MAEIVNIPADRPVDFAYLFSSPLVRVDASKEITALDFRAERELLFNVFKSQNRFFTVFCSVATVFSLGDLIARRCLVLHYSGHGQEQHLTFEDKEGKVKPVPPSALRDLCSVGSTANDSGHGIKLVVVSACHSEQSGRAFVEAGVSHVVAIRCDEKVSDFSARIFNRTFYNSLLKGKTVRYSFDSAIAQVSLNTSNQSEKRKFLLLPENTNHDIVIFPCLAIGTMVDQTPPEPDNNLRALPDCFVGRNLDLQKLVSSIIEPHSRLISVYGESGIGKSALTLAAARYISERREQFPGGCFIIPMRNFRSKSDKKESLSSLITREMRKPTRFPLCYDDDQFIDMISTQSSEKILLIFDDVDAFINLKNDDPCSFYPFLQKFLDLCPNLNVVVTSIEQLHGIPNAAMRALFIPGIERRYAAKIFLERSVRPITTHEVGCIHPTHIPAGLQHHSIITICNGNPRALIKAAQLLSNTVGLNDLPGLLAKEDQEEKLPEIQEIEETLTQSFSQNIPNYLIERIGQLGESVINLYWTQVISSGVEFWNTLGTPRNVKWPIFAKEMISHFAKTTSFDSPLERQIIPDDLRFLNRVSLRCGMINDEISIYNFILFWPFFVALEKMVKSLVSVWGSYFQNEWVIQGFVTRDVAEFKLRDAQPGTFILRFSESFPGNLSVSYVTVSREIDHFLIDCLHGDVSLRHCVRTVYDNGYISEWPTIESLLMSHSSLHYVYPSTPKEIAFGLDLNLPC